MTDASNDILVAILTSVISSATVLTSIWFKIYLDKRKITNNLVSREDKSLFYLEMDQVCSSIRESVSADGSYLAYFHNGGMFTNGIAMDKFTVVGEDYNQYVKFSSYKKLYAAIMINYIAYAYHRLLTNNKYQACSTLPCGDNCKAPNSCDLRQEVVADLSFRNDLIKRKISNVYMYLIKDPKTEKPIGFFALEYINSHVMNDTDDSKIWKHQNKLSRLLSMTVL
jgi:hypothetical protein